ncbi:MAG TPA: HypC/HybG/HupF family hydrogenase formation chaperone [Ktedonobacteraceae bacterium]|nr:HypC/HybG/HupF family hydrogenase formation chaperone [Ktedonobacteraceae bacterium]
MSSLHNHNAIDVPATKRFEVLSASAPVCELDAQGHCVTCSDEALPFTVLRVDAEAGIAIVSIEGAIDHTEEEVDITLVDDVLPGDVLLVHGGVAIAQVERSSLESVSEASDA